MSYRLCCPLWRDIAQYILARVVVTIIATYLIRQTQEKRLMSKPNTPPYTSYKLRERKLNLSVQKTKTARCEKNENAKRVEKQNVAT